MRRSLSRPEEGQDGDPTLGLLYDFCGAVRAFRALYVVYLYSILTNEKKTTTGAPHILYCNWEQVPNGIDLRVLVGHVGAGLW
jgi:hypothetical protein